MQANQRYVKVYATVLSFVLDSGYIFCAFFRFVIILLREREGSLALIVSLLFSIL